MESEVPENYKLCDTETLKKAFLKTKNITEGCDRDPFVDHTELIEEITACKCTHSQKSFKCSEFSENDVRILIDCFVLGKTNKERDKIFAQHLNTNCPEKNGKRCYYLMGRQICKNRFVILTHSSSNKLNAVEKKIKNPQIAPPSSATKETKKRIILQYFQETKESLVRIDCDPSAKARFLLPCNMTKQQDVYEDYKDWMQQKHADHPEMISLNKHFFKTWKSHFPDVCLQQKGYMKYVIIFRFILQFFNLILENNSKLFKFS